MHGSHVLVLCSVLAMVASAGCTGLTPRAQQQLSGGYQRYAAGDNAGAIEQMDAFLQENPHSRRTGEAYYLRGLARYNLRQYDRAKLDLEQTVSETGNPELQAKAALALGDLSYDTADMTLAENMYRHAIATLAPRDPLAAQGLYRLGCVLQRLGRWREADAQFHKALFYFPDSEAAKRSARCINANAWCVQAGSYGRMVSAEAGAKRLSAGGLPARALVVRQDKATQFVVQVGHFGRYEEAVEILPQVRALQTDAFITVTR